MATISPIILSITMLAIFALFAGGGWLIVRRRDRVRGGLMLVAALVLLFNVWIWTMPV
jgi:hypothetical protein